MSTKDVLSDEEIDALMDTVEDGPTDQAALDENGDYQLFDFAAREMALLGQMPALKTINEKVCNEMEESLCQSFRMPFDVEITGMEILKLDECLKSLSEFSAINVLKFNVVSGMSLVVMSGGLLSEIINRYFGSSFNGAGLPQNERQLTATESRMNERLLSHVISALQSGWQEVTPLEAQLVAIETNPEFVKLGDESDMGVRFSFKLTMDEIDETISWVLPYAALEALRPKLGNLALPLSDGSGTQNWEQLFAREIRHVDLDLTAEFTEINMSLRDVLKLTAGSILPMRIPEKVKVYSGDVPIFCGEYGSYETNKAVSMTHKLTTADA